MARADISMSLDEVEGRNTKQDRIENVVEMKPIRIQFTIRSTYAFSLTPKNLIGLCSETAHLEHIISSYKTALTQRRSMKHKCHIFPFEDKARIQMSKVSIRKYCPILQGKV